MLCNLVCSAGLPQAPQMLWELVMNSPFPQKQTSATTTWFSLRKLSKTLTTIPGSFQQHLERAAPSEIQPFLLGADKLCLGLSLVPKKNQALS